MALWDLSPKITILARHTTKRPYFSGEHLFFRVKGGTGALRMEMSRDPTCADPMLDTYQTLTLNGTPLALIQASGCPTCQSLLAAGHGLPVDCPQLRQAADAIAAPFDHLEEALERLAPVTGLLPSGYFILSLVDCYPTDGSGHFFWDIPNGFTLSPATAQTFDPETYSVLPVFPRFLHPTQPAAKHDPRRVEEYRRQLRAGKRLSPALCHAAFEYLSILLDGHHRACACALEGVPVPCLILSSPRFLGKDGDWKVIWPDEERETVPGLSIPLEKMRRCWSAPPSAPPPTPGELFGRRWEPDYQKAAALFPDVVEAGALALYGRDALDAEGIQELQDREQQSALVSPALLRYFLRQPGTDAKRLALSFARPWAPLPLRTEAFRALSAIKGNPEIEDFFVDYLVGCDDRDDPLRRIADRYWD